MTRPSLFEGSYLGDDSKLAPDARLECGICWHVYDPAEGDPVWQVPPGTPFAALPGHWRCPNCDAPKHKYMLLDGSAGDGGPRPLGRVEALAQAYGRAERQMRDLPIHNPALAVETVGFRAFGDGLLGIVISPWFMNLTLLPEDPAGWAELSLGASVDRALPSGVYPFLVGDLDGVGRVLTCSLFSPMHEFQEQAVARITAEAALEEVLRPPAPPPTPAVRELSRRSLFGAAAD